METRCSRIAAATASAAGSGWRTGPVRARLPASIATEKLRMRNSAGSISGAARRRACAARIARRTVPPVLPSAINTGAGSSRWPKASINACKAAAPTPTNTNPSQSKRACGMGGVAGMKRAARSDAQQTDRHVDEEVPAPRGIRGDEAPDRRAPRVGPTIAGSSM